MSASNIARADRLQAARTGGLVVALILIVAVGVTVVAYLMFLGARFAGFLPALVSLLVAVIFAIAPLVACFVQTVSISRQSNKLQNMITPELKETQYFKLASANLTSIKPASVTQSDFRLPILLFSAIITVCSLLSLMGLFWSDNLQTNKTALLGGLYILGDVKGPQIGQYQSGTLVVATIAFLGAYLALFRRLLDQLNNNDIYPISFYYYALWLLSAMVIAAIARHIASVFGPGVADSGALLLVAFAIGAAPTPFFAAFVHWAFAKLKVSGDKNDPQNGALPTNLSLLMIDGLENDKIDRLSELEITDPQVLSCQNPFTLWVRLPYEFAMIVDWISQAQLYVCLREEGMPKARAQQINDIHKFVKVMSTASGAADLCNELGLKPSFVAPLLASLSENACFVRLQEVKNAMIGNLPLDAGVREPSVEASAPVVQLAS